VCRQYLCASPFYSRNIAGASASSRAHFDDLTHSPYGFIPVHSPYGFIPVSLGSVLSHTVTIINYSNVPLFAHTVTIINYSSPLKDKYTTVNTSQLLTPLGVSDAFLNDVMSAITNVIYTQARFSPQPWILPPILARLCHVSILHERHLQVHAGYYSDCFHYKLCHNNEGRCWAPTNHDLCRQPTIPLHATEGRCWPPTNHDLCRQPTILPHATEGRCCLILCVDVRIVHVSACPFPVERTLHFSL
jgi:hypothetical protein